jgi:ribosomal protein S18 acetylase RimI-like enzyme
MEIQELTGWPDELREQARALYECSFPIQELRDFDELFERNPRLLAARDGDLLLGFSIFRILEEASLGYLWYLCVDQSARGRGIGRQLYQRTLDSLKNGNHLKGLIFEVERLDSESHPIYGDPIRRVKFYERLGARLILGYDYRQPPIPPYGEVPLQLMYHPIGGTPSEAELARIVEDFLRWGQGVEKEVDPRGLHLG